MRGVERPWQAAKANYETVGRFLYSACLLFQLAGVAINIFYVVRDPPAWENLGASLICAAGAGWVAALWFNSEKSK